MEWLIQQFETYAFSVPVSDKFLPRPYIHLIFHFKSCPTIDDVTPIRVEPLFVAPIIPKAIHLAFEGETDTFVITCKASVFSKLFKVDLSPISKKSISLSQPELILLWEEMSKLETTELRISCFSNFIHAIQTTPYIPDAIDVFYDKIIEKSITTPLKDIMQECAASKSTLLRKFTKRTGVNPKTLTRVVRFNYLWNKINDENAIDYQELIFDTHYFDQSHFINDFKAITGETPSCFFKRNLEVVKLLSGK